jgi:hypothetical protein
MHDARHNGRGLTCRQLFQCDGSQDYANLLNAGPQHLAEGFLILAGYLEVDGAP